MAKAKKPASGNKKTPQTPKADAAKPVVDAADPKKVEIAAPSKASQAATAKVSDKATVASNSDSTAKAEKASDNTKAASAAAKPADAKPPVDAKAPTAKDTPTSAVKAADAKSVPKAADIKEPTKPDTQSTAAATAEVKKTPASAPPKQAEPEKSRSVFLPLVFGGLVAGGLGFAAAEMNVLNTRVDTDAIRADTKAIQETLAAQKEKIAAFVPTDLSAVEGSIADVSETISALETRLAEFENRPVVIAEDGTAALSKEFAENLETLKASIEEQKTEVAEQKAEVEEQKAEIARLLENALSVEEATANSARDAAIQGASAKLIAALSSGEPYAEVLEDLSAAGIDDLPAELTDPASDGVATVSGLQSEFPATARAALALARTSGVDAGTGGVGGFLKRQLGARSVAPREGDDPDAILSRAEAAVRDGQVGDALTELDGLPPEVQSAMEEWLVQARTRAGAEQAVQDLSERLTAN